MTEPASDDWTLTGNAGINSSSRFIGTSDTSSVSFRTNNTEAMRIANNGNVGIGTGNPQAKLDISGQVKISTLSYSSSNSNEIHLIGTSPSGEIKGLNIIGHAPDFPVSSCINPYMGWFNNTCSGSDPNKLFKIPMEGNLGIGTDNPQAKVEIVSDATNGTAFQVSNGDLVTLLKVKDDGKVGIGESNPGEKLTVNGNVHLTGTLLGKQNTGALFINGNTTSNDGGTIELYGSGSGASKEVHVIGKSIKFYDSPSANQWDQNMTIIDNGDVGIGTASPSGRLHIAANYNDQSHIAFQVTNSSGTNLFSIRDNGQIGINWSFASGHPSNSDYKLAVNGKVFAQGFTIKSSAYWPDYVFKPEYTLLSLIGLEEYVKSEHHLPHVPSAESIKEYGIDVEEMNVALLKSLEEITLYVIDLQKQLNELKSKCGEE